MIHASVSSLLVSAAVVAFAEIGDKTQLLAFFVALGVAALFDVVPGFASAATS